jgi:hypothetical protein
MLPAGPDALPGALEGCHMPQDQVATENRSQYERWLAALDAFSVQFLVLDVQHDREILQLVRSRPGWAIDFADGESALLARVRTPDKTPVTA